MSSPLRENLEVFSDGNASFIRCMRCGQVLCQASADWKQACVRRLLPPTEAGPLMNDLVGLFALEQLCCPSCGILLSTDLVEEHTDAGQ